MEIIRGMYGLPQSGIISNNLLAHHWINHGYYKVKQLPGFWQHLWRPITFTLVVDYFGVGYVVREHTDHLTSALKVFMQQSQHIGKGNYTAV